MKPRETPGWWPAFYNGLEPKPRVIVFDLDGTVWDGDVECLDGPPFRCENNTRILCAKNQYSSWGLEIFPQSLQILDWFVCERDTARKQGDVKEVNLACASRTSEPQWSPIIMSQFFLPTSRISLNQCWDESQIYPGNKQQHIRRIAARFSCENCEILFFDNEWRNIQSVGDMGVCSYFCPKGLSWEVLKAGLKQFAASK
eukprot:Gregarina_sp_Poly_1__2280@NODE_1605_length_3728_cov_60_541382_g1057_i0_p2_GENE_NODE_1605_length_3728_cov_60_541382_g1057_i0NODE_1605_length_3728_cov_60_541382_g1057_i0_p2_ORF_typecomplete_len200_score26_26Acid_PPase/PF12689_7/1e36zfFPG_IleRS/PF06827_14/4_1e03zfFPG_IleRS/PF06827_14/0_32HAD_2/PF13419_6/59HAD_2/PF13419_6/28_NODE_1605_length_3728_cov_60_541382_g1057_i029303529